MKTRNRDTTLASMLLLGLSSSLINLAQANEQTVTSLLQTYGATDARADRGKQLWEKSFNRGGEFTERSCASCHYKDLTRTGQHIKTRKLIKPMSPSANPERLTNEKKVEKWFKRNCKWTIGRECSTAEKADLLLYINKKVKF